MSRPTSRLRRRDALLTLLAIYDLHTAPLDRIKAAAQWQHHPTIAAVKGALEDILIADLDNAIIDDVDRTDAVAALRALAHADLVPEVYEWAANDATLSELIEFLALEGGPDSGFDDLVAVCQVGLGGAAKVELARNYWDEMGNGDPSSVHGELHGQMVEALGIPEIPRTEQPTESLQRAALNGLLATNRVLLPEMVGALGLIELQAGPRCRKVLAGLERVGAPRASFPFYAVHASVDPRHGRDWLNNAVAPLAAEHPEWGPQIIRGAQWRAAVNARFFAAMAQRFRGRTRLSA